MATIRKKSESVFSAKLEHAWMYNVLARHPAYAGTKGAIRAGSCDFLPVFLKEAAGIEFDDEGWEPRRFRAWRRKAAKLKPLRVKSTGVLAANVALLGELVRLDALEQEILLLAVHAQARPVLCEVFGEVGLLSRRELVELVAVALARPLADVEKALKPRGRLVESGVLGVENGPARWPLRVEINERLLDLLETPDLDRDQIVHGLFPRLAASTLSFADYAHVKEPVELTLRILKASLGARARGTNILVHGYTGVGKTQLARLLADTLEVPLWSIGSADEDGDPMTPGGRINDARLAQRLLGQSTGVMLFDECDDAFPTSMFGDRRPSKVWVNELLETNQAPVIWLTNDVTGLDPAMKRRFTFSFEMKEPGAGVRKRVLEKALGDDATALGRGALEKLSEDCVAGPAQVQSAVTTSRLVSESGVELSTLRRLLHASSTLVTGRPSMPTSNTEPPYCWDAVRCSVRPRALVDRLKAVNTTDAIPSARLLLSGASGTGKSEYAKQTARLLGRELLVVRTSDLLDKYVGGTEANIASAFARASAEQSVLLLDEVDSVLRDRNLAERSWETTQVNEFLQQLEAFEGLVFCTTNRLDDLDPAALRRFDFKITFDGCTPEQAARLFAAYFAPAFDRDLTRADLRKVESGCARLGLLAPGDFAAVSRRLRYATESVTIDSLLSELAAETSLKRGARNEIGFGPVVEVV